MKKRCLIMLMLLAAGLYAKAQQETTLSKNTFFVEIGGNAGLYSLNVDHLLWLKPKSRFAVRAGFGYLYGLGVSGRHIFGLPLEISWLYGKSKHMLELGVGQTTYYDTYYPGASRVHDLVLQAVGRVGYRYQKPEGGLFFKTGATPLAGMIVDLRQDPNPEFTLNDGPEYFAFPMVGVALGYTLRVE